jgi:hypothetical protein
MSITKTANGFHISPDLDYTDNMFEFPVIVERRDKEKDQLEELGVKLSDDDGSDEADRIVGYIAFPHEYIVGYADWMSKNRTNEEVREYGFDLTEVYVRGEMTTYLCTWKRETFKKKLNEHVKNLNKKANDSVKDQMEDFFKNVKFDVDALTAQSNDPNQKSLGWFGRLRFYLNRLFSGA